jgi:hypothetical protein
MSRAYTVEQYVSQFDADVHRANITRLYINSEDDNVLKEFAEVNKARQGYYQLVGVPTTYNVTYRKFLIMSPKERKQTVIEFLVDLYIEVAADIHSGTLSSNWCRLVDEIRLALGKTIPFYTPENVHMLT